MREKEDIILIVSLYVDDLIFTGNDELMFTKFKSSMKHEFDMTDLGKMRYFLVLEVMQRIDGIFLCKKNALEMLQRFGMDISNSVQTPIVPSIKLTKDDTGAKVDKTYYKQIVGSLMYLTSTRPDIMFVVNLISRYMENPIELHLLAAKRVLRYLRGETKSFLLTLTVIMQEIWMIEKYFGLCFLIVFSCCFLVIKEITNCELINYRGRVHRCSIVCLSSHMVENGVGKIV